MKVLIATDGSDFSREAIKKSCRIITKESDLAIKIISVYEASIPIAAEPAVFPAEYLTEINKGLKKEAEENVSEAVKLLKKSLPGTKFDLSTRVEMGNPKQLIIDTAGEWKADLIVMGSHGRGFWGRTLIGSTSDAIIHNAPCPVLVIRKSEDVRVKSTAGTSY